MNVAVAAFADERADAAGVNSQKSAVSCADGD
jgi:hypothetical protein